MKHFVWMIAAAIGWLSVAPVSAQLLEGKWASLDENPLPFLVESLKHEKPGRQQEAYFMLMKYQPLPRDLAPALAQLVQSQKGNAQALAAALLADIDPDHPGLLEALRQGLADYQVTRRPSLAGLVKLGEKGRPALPDVLKILDTPGDPNTQDVAAAFIAQMGKEALEPLEKIILKSVASKKRNAGAALALGRLGPEAVPTILRLFDQNNDLLDWHLAVALKSMPEKSLQALPYMLIFARSKDDVMKRLAFDYLVGVNPSTEEIDELLWKGLEDQDAVIWSKCYVALRARSKDRQRWIAALKNSSRTDDRVVTHLLELDPEEGKKLLQAIALRDLIHRFPNSPRVFQLADMEQYLDEIIPRHYPLLDQETPSVRISILNFLLSVSPKYSREVEAKLRKLLDERDATVKLLAAKALLRTNPADKGRPARAVGEALSFPNRPHGFDVDGALDVLRGLGPEAKPALLSLRAMLNRKQDPLTDVKVLVTMAAIDPATKPAALERANQMYASDQSKRAGAVLLIQLQAPNAEEARQTLYEAVNLDSKLPTTLRMIEWLGPDARFLAPRLERLFEHPLNSRQVETAFALARVDGDLKQAAQRLRRLLRREDLVTPEVISRLRRLGLPPDAVRPDFDQP